MSKPDLRQPPPGKHEASRLVRAAERAGTVWHRAPSIVIAVRGRLLRRRAAEQFRKFPRPYRLCLGSGRAPIEGWTNIDYYFPADITLDLTYGLPIPDESAELIYSEHLIEHFPLDTNLRLFTECHRVLRPGGRMRIATPDLAELVADYRTNWRQHDWVNWDEYRWIDSGTRMVNVALREWGHLYLWDFEELADRLASAGFADIRRFSLGESDEPALRSLETRSDSKLIVEAIARKAPK
jgi:predicted SAM-dependent methyltransferase